MEAPLVFLFFSSCYNITLWWYSPAFLVKRYSSYLNVIVSGKFHSYSLCILCCRYFYIIFLSFIILLLYIYISYDCMICILWKVVMWLVNGDSHVITAHQYSCCIPTFFMSEEGARPKRANNNKLSRSRSIVYTFLPFYVFQSYFLYASGN